MTPLRVVRMLAFAADTLRGTALTRDTYRGAHRGRGTAAKDIRWLGTGLLFAIISYCGYAISAACLAMAVARAVRYLPGPRSCPGEVASRQF